MILTTLSPTQDSAGNHQDQFTLEIYEDIRKKLSHAPVDTLRPDLEANDHELKGVVLTAITVLTFVLVLAGGAIYLITSALQFFL